MPRYPSLIHRCSLFSLILLFGAFGWSPTPTAATMDRRKKRDRSNYVISSPLGAMLICLGGLAVWLRLRFRWRGFLPGVLVGFGLTCLVPIGIVAVICGMHR